MQFLMFPKGEERMKSLVIDIPTTCYHYRLYKYLKLLKGSKSTISGGIIESPVEIIESLIKWQEILKTL